MITTKQTIEVINPDFSSDISKIEIIFQQTEKGKEELYGFFWTTISEPSRPTRDYIIPFRPEHAYYLKMYNTAFDETKISQTYWINGGKCNIPFRNMDELNQVLGNLYRHHYLNRSFVDEIRKAAPELALINISTLERVAKPTHPEIVDEIPAVFIDQHDFRLPCPNGCLAVDLSQFPNAEQQVIDAFTAREEVPDIFEGTMFKTNENVLLFIPPAPDAVIRFLKTLLKHTVNPFYRKYLSSSLEKQIKIYLEHEPEFSKTPKDPKNVIAYYRTLIYCSDYFRTSYIDDNANIYLETNPEKALAALAHAFALIGGQGENFRKYNIIGKGNFVSRLSRLSPEHRTRLSYYRDQISPAVRANHGITSNHFEDLLYSVLENNSKKTAEILLKPDVFKDDKCLFRIYIPQLINFKNDAVMVLANWIVRPENHSLSDPKTSSTAKNYLLRYQSEATKKIEEAKRIEESDLFRFIQEAPVVEEEALCWVPEPPALPQLQTCSSDEAPALNTSMMIGSNGAQALTSDASLSAQPFGFELFRALRGGFRFSGYPQQTIGPDLTSQIFPSDSAPRRNGQVRTTEVPHSLNALYIAAGGLLFFAVGKSIIDYWNNEFATQKQIKKAQDILVKANTLHDKLKTALKNTASLTEEEQALYKWCVDYLEWHVFPLKDSIHKNRHKDPKQPFSMSLNDYQDLKQFFANVQEVYASSKFQSIQLTRKK